MQIKKDLPPRYYLDHFRDMISAIRKNHFSFLGQEHHAFLDDFQSLTEEAQCLYVRFVNRKGKYFFRETLRYPEIGNVDAALNELKNREFVIPPAREDLLDIFRAMAKEKLHEFCEFLEIPVKKSWAKPRFIEVLSEAELERFPIERLGNCVVQRKLDELSYLLFLYFGEISENLSLYTMRDLGIWSENKRDTFVPKFTSRDEATANFFYARLIDQIDTSTYDYKLIEFWPAPVNEQSLYLRETLIVALGEELKKNDRLIEALEVLEKATIHPGRERKIRLLYQMGELEQTLSHLHDIMENPSSDEELIFAEDFLERKFHQKKRSALTQILQDAETLQIDEAYYRRPEEGVRDALVRRGMIVHHSENAVWRTLFGILFWHEIFESPINTFHSQFERLPEELGSAQFFVKHHEAITTKLHLVNSHAEFKEYVETLKLEKGTDKNGIFGWGEDTLNAVMDLCKYAPVEKLAAILVYLASDFHRRMRGFPDLLIIENDEVRFAEIKAPGDSLRSHQLLQMKILEKAGFPVEILKVEYKVSPEQTYVVVDLETTGGMLPYHRITEIGAVKIRGGEIIDRYETLVNPRKRISEEIQKLTNITNEMVKTAPLFSDVATAFQEFSKDAIFVAHNVNFDYGFLQAEYERLDERFVRPFLCTKLLMRKYFPDLESYSLANLTAHFKVPLINHHRAMCDAEATAKLFLIINQKR